MANTYSQINIHAVFTVQGRENLLKKEFREKVLEYISDTMRSIGLIPLAVNGIEDHVHIFYELTPNISVSKALQEIKSNSSKWINEQGLVPGKFQWQKGFGAFSYSRSQRNKVIQYIKDQENHHSNITFREEYLRFLAQFEIEFNKNYLFEFYII